MANKIILKKSSVAAKAPVAGDLDFGELAINYTDSKLYFKKADGSIGAFSSASTNGTSSRQLYTATAGQTTFAINYEVGYIDAYLNGVKQQLGVDFTATNGTSINLTTGAIAGDVVDLVAYSTFVLADFYSKVESDNQYLQLTGGVITGNLGIGTATPAQKLSVAGVIESTTGGVKFPDGTTQTTAASGASALTISNKTAAYTVVAGDLGTIINCTSGTFTVSLTAAATLGSGFNVTIWNTSTIAGNIVTINPAGAETIDGVSVLALRPGEGMQIVCDGTNWTSGNKKVMRMYAENFGDASQARPIASGNFSLALGRGSTASGVGSFAYNYGSFASNDYGIAIGSYTSASSAYSVAIGNNSAGFVAGSQAVTGAGAMALGGSYASGTDSFAAAVANNTATYGANNTNSVVIGQSNRASSSGGYGTSIGGFSNISSANWAMTLGGRSCNAAFDYTVALGYQGTPNVVGKMACGHASGVGAGIGWGILSLYRVTTDATAAVLVSSSVTTPSTVNQLILPNNSAYAFSGTIVARQSAANGTASAAWKVEGLIRREGSAGTTVLVNSALTVLSNVPGWVIALTADTTNGGLAITATGAAATNIRWVATIQTSEVTYA